MGKLLAVAAPVEPGAGVVVAAALVALSSARAKPEQMTWAFEERLGAGALRGEPVASELQRVLTGDAAEVDVAFTCEAGPPCRGTATAVLGADGRRRALVCVALPVERGAGGGATMLAALADRSQAIVWLKELDGRYAHVNDAYADAMGIGRDEIVGRLDSDLPPRAAVDGARAVGTGHSEPLRLEYTIPAVDGRPALAALRFPILSGDGAPVAVCGVAAPAAEARLAQAECVRLLEAERSLRVTIDELREEVMGAWGLTAPAAPGPEAGGGRDGDRPDAAARNELVAARSELDRVVLQLQEVTRARDALERQLAEERGRVGGLHDASAAAAKRAHELIGELAAQREQSAEREAALERAEAEAERARRELASERERADELGRELAAARAAAAQSGSGAQAAEAQAAEAVRLAREQADEAVRQEREVAGELRRALDAASERMQQLERRLAEQQREQEQTLSERERDESIRSGELIALRADLAAVAHERDEAREALADARRGAGDALADARREVGDAMAAARREAEAARAALAQAQADLETARSELVSAQREIEDVSGQRDLERLRADAGERARAEAEHRAEADTAPPSAVPPGEPEPPLDLPTWNAQGQLELTGALASASSWRAGARDATRILGTAGGWDLVVIWEREQRVARFACASMWCADPSTRARFETATWQSQQAALGTAVGRAAVASSPCWHVDLEAAEDPHLRAAAAEGMRSALLVPLRHGQEVIGVLELCSRVEHASGEEVTTAAAAVGVQLAHLERMLRLGSAPRWTVGRM